MLRCRRYVGARALTLLEVVIAVALMALLLGALVSFFWQTLSIRESAGKSAARTQIVQQMLDCIANELRNCAALQDTGFPLEQFTGTRRSITFLTTPLPPKDLYGFFRDDGLAPPPRNDLLEVTYELWIDPDDETEEGEPLVGGILRTERRALRPYLTEGEVAEGEDLKWMRRDLWSPELGYLEFRYFDGVEWSTTWTVQEGNKLPHQVMVTVGFDSLTRDQLEDKDLDTWPLAEYPLGPEEPNPNCFTRIVRIPAADQMFSARAYRLQSGVEELFETPGAGEEAGEGGAEGLEGGGNPFGDVVEEEETVRTR